MPYSPIKIFVPLIFIIGALRMTLTTLDLDQYARYFSMTSVILIASIFFSSMQTTRSQRVTISYSLIAPYMTVETISLGYAWWSGKETIFQTWPYNLGFSIQTHFWGHLIGGLTWEPLLVYWLVTTMARLRGNHNRS